jgi:hypothetical protein
MLYTGQFSPDKGTFSPLKADTVFPPNVLQLHTTKRLKAGGETMF